MKTVIVRPERCVGCMQCSIACAVAHSASKELYSTVFEGPAVSPRIHVGPGPETFAYPNKCRHCDPAPCMSACMTRAISRDKATSAVLVTPSRCINCGMCSMACPFGVIRFRKDARATEKKAVSVKCDNCVERQKAGKIPACVETCKVGALLFGDPNELLKQETRELSMRIGESAKNQTEGEKVPEAVALWRAVGEIADKVS